jgi:hypothetical protein
MAKIPLPPYRNGLPDLKMEAKTAAYQVTKEDSGTVFHTTGATAAVTFTLPPITDGPFWFLFICGADIGMTVASKVADTAVTFNDLAADSVAFSTSAEMIGAQIEVYCDGTTLFVLPRLASEGQTVTIATA